MLTAPLAIDLFCGLGGWTEGLLAEGYRVVGFDIERHVYGEHQYPAQLVLQDVLTIHGRQFKDAALIVASPPCQEFSYMAMPWSLAKQKIRDYETGVRDVKQLTALFDACFRIQREASEAKGEHIPLVVENVRGAQEWVGRAKWHFGSFYLWGDVPALMPMTRGRAKVPGMGAGWRPPGHPDHQAGLDFNTRAERQMKNNCGSWFNVARNTTSGHSKNPVHALAAEGVKQRGSGREWLAGDGKISRLTSSKSPARKAASAMIAKIPLVLSRHIAAAWKPQSEVA
jgi:hypothetical protein